MSIIPDSIVVQELVYRYNYTEEQAKTIVSFYKKHHKISELEDLIQQNLLISLTKEDLCESYFRG